MNKRTYLCMPFVVIDINLIPILTTKWNGEKWREKATVAVCAVIRRAGQRKTEPNVTVLLYYSALAGSFSQYLQFSLYEIPWNFIAVNEDHGIRSQRHIHRHTCARANPDTLEPKFREKKIVIQRIARVWELVLWYSESSAKLSTKTNNTHRQTSIAHIHAHTHTRSQVRV